MRFGLFSHRKGFTLVEALSASVVLAIGLFAVGLALSSEFAFIYKNREGAIATLAAQEEIESLRGMPYDTILNLGTSFTADGFQYLISPAGELAMENSFGPDIKKITVTVRWNSLDGRASQTQLVTMMSRDGINKQ